MECYRLDLFDKFSPFEEKLEKVPKTQDLISTDKFSPFEEKLEKVPKTQDLTSTEQVQVVPAEPFIPKLIV